MEEANRAETIRRIFAAYLANDRKFVESAFSDDFRFISPYDNAINKLTYFERCWKGSDWIDRHELEKIVVDGDQAFVTYRCVAKGGRAFRNTEFFVFDGDKVKRTTSISARHTRTAYLSGIRIETADVVSSPHGEERGFAR
ncbi:nuclear transport factor 2 family protein [Bradyrhizobium archetypum]|uniref:nuclear transport factor 2 family protein n=1 Tax=Bradyrhizobium archetypum TaxID=2721160 RepID=UPI00289CDA5A|nr:nuclear transport factor 2 family protein [Bradyrhizobium archetypum]